MKARIALLVFVVAAGLAACTSTITAPTPDRSVGTGPVTEETGFAGGMGNGN